MPQLKKVVLAVGNRLIYANTYDEALSQLSGGAQALVEQATAAAPAASAAASTAKASAPTGDPRLQRVREHLQRYRELTAQGHLSEAGKELEAIEAEVSESEAISRAVGRSLLRGVGRAQSTDEMARIAQSPYEIERFVEKTPAFEWEPLWKALHIQKRSSCFVRRAPGCNAGLRIGANHYQ